MTDAINKPASANLFVNLFEDAGKSLYSSANMRKGVMEGDLSLIKEAIKYGGNIVDDTPTDTSYILLAAREKQWHVVDYLINEKADLNKTNRYGWSLLHEMCKNAEISLIKKVIKSGGYLNAKDEWGDSPLMIAIKSKREDLIDYLIGIDTINLESRDKENRTTLHIAAEIESHDTFIKLWQRGVMLDLVDSKGKTAIDYLKDTEFKNSLPDIEAQIKISKDEFNKYNKNEPNEVVQSDEAIENNKPIVLSEESPKVSGLSGIKRKSKATP